MSEHIIIERDGAVAELRLARPEKRNAITTAMYAALADGIGAAHADAGVRAVLISGEGSSFTAGNDLHDFIANPPQGRESPVFRFLHGLADATKPIVAAVQGQAVGIGTTMLLHCDIVVLADDARLRMPFVDLALVPEAASSLLVPRAIGHARAADTATGHRLRIFMDLGGPKIRTGEVRLPKHAKQIGKGGLLAVVPPGGLERVSLEGKYFAVECTLPDALGAARVGDRLFVDDGKLGAMVERVEPWGLVARVISAPIKGVHLKPEKGLNFPDTDLHVAALTPKDLADLDFVAAHADAIEFSFVQSAVDVASLQDALAKRRPGDWRTCAIVLKIETALGVRNLPDILVQAAGRQPTAIMIARGDLAVEIGFARTAEMQEEILWIGEAAHVPVIWATQVLEHLVQKGTPSRGEMTDAAMAARAECVMLNKGPYLFDAIDQLGPLLGRMEEHQHKKTPQLRRLKSW